MPVVAAFPTQIPTFTAKVDDIDTVFADHINILQAEVRAIASALGTLPAGTASSVKARIQAAEDSVNTIAGRFDSGGLIPQAGVVGLVSSLSSLAGSGVVLTAWTAFTPVLRFGGVAATYTDPSYVRGAYKLVGKTLSFNISVNTSAFPIFTPAAASFDLPAGAVSAARTQVVSCAYRMGSPMTGYPDGQWQNQLVQPGVNNVALIAHSSDGTGTASPTGLAELYANGVIEVV